MAEFWIVAMFSSYLHVFFRNFLRNRFYVLINVIGFTFGILCLIFLSLWFEYESDTRQNQESNERLIKIGRSDKEHSELIIREGKQDIKILFPETPMPLAAYLVKAFPEISYTTRFAYDGTKFVVFKGAVYEENRFAFADTNILKIFRFKYIRGNHRSAFSKSNSVIISEHSAGKYFPGENPIGKFIVLSDSTKYEVTAVVRDIPEQYKFQFDFLVGMNHMSRAYEGVWDLDKVNTYALLDKNISIPNLENRLIRSTSGLNCGVLRIWEIPRIGQYENILAYNDRMDDDPMNFIFSISILFILVTACINYANISTALSSKRAVEVGMRKALGAGKLQIITQFLGEAVLLSFFSLLIAVVISLFAVPYFNSVTGFDLKFDFTFEFILRLILISVISGFAAGIYPAIFMSGFRPIKILKGDFRSGPKGEIFRKLLVVFQFSVSVTLIISSFLVYEQYELLENKKLAYDTEYYLEVPLKDNSVYDKIKVDLRKNPKVLDVEMTDESSKRSVVITVEAIDIRKSVNLAEDVWEKYFPDDEFVFSFQNPGFNKIFQLNNMKSNILYFFTIVIVLVSYLGLFGHSAFMVKQKSGEIALRKAFGASFWDILLLISGEYVKLVFVANLIAFFYVVWPLNTWFKRFSYRINISYEAFLYTLLITIGLALITVAFHSIIASMKNPAELMGRD